LNTSKVQFFSQEKISRANKKSDFETGCPSATQKREKKTKLHFNGDLGDQTGVEK